MEWLVLGLFLLGLVSCIVSGASVVWALAAGYVLFFAYGVYQGIAARELLQLSGKGLMTVRKILTVMVLIGMLTTVWRSGGTIPMIVALAGNLIQPSAFVLLTFVLNCLISCLIGTSLGTAATMGVICMTMASLLGVSPVLTGGAVMSGIYFGDRCSPLSTSALLVATITRTDFFHNLTVMARKAVLPFILSCVVYALLGWHQGSAGMDFNVWPLFAAQFQLHWLTLIPALVIIILSLAKVDVRKTMCLSILIAFILTLTLQHGEVGPLCKMLITGYQTADPKLAPMLNGGGILSMLPAIAIIAISATYAGLFERTQLLAHLYQTVENLARHIGTFGCVWLVSLFISMISCAQTLAVILTDELCKKILPDKEKMMIALEDTVIVSAALIPWCIASAIPLTTLNVSAGCLFFAVYLYLQPLCSWLCWRH